MTKKKIKKKISSHNKAMKYLAKLYIEEDEYYDKAILDGFKKAN